MRDRIELWKRVYDTDDNAISKALSKLAWDLTAFTCVVEIVRQAPDGEDGKQLNGMVLEMLVSGFWSSTMQGVRRLAERDTIHGQRGVCSIGGLLLDAKAVRQRITRRVFVEDIASLGYNYAAIEEQYRQFLRAQAPGQAHWVPRDYHYEPSAQRHAVFDWLSGTTPGTSTPDDLIREEVFDTLERRLARLDGVVEHVNVEIAHAATEFSRTGRALQQWNLDDAKGAIKELAQIAQLVGEWFCFSGIGSVLPHPQFDQFAHLDQPLFNGDRQQLQTTWDALEQEIRQWHDVDPRAL
ncbi:MULTISPECIES: hypothetical protein [Xanthomonas]|uniref:hypothetical protein n=1 Tax=Xanthomonas TaxID=338 RepID=UPI00062D8073|nr:hypothetical protein [Xanthomonas hortorum]KLA94576.1 hypothetical protein SM19410_17650 [Xanthomonas hortorum pv. gardneri]KLB18604.1 hypothetical protein SM40611_14125 [Xanthomonas hortorum pv. gardneri]KLB22527.1 hypothetical protein SM41311_12290 [Xanthomonas hortorum pv. gardneri]KLB31242.1 hypothetical protein SM77512_03660 [Xanthomonas hortorum pv. gardneri]KLB32405.1 hypothetical protein SM79512_17545 [Xanthomonas hortorum pv. gardneri]